jgi:hypothetical protein
MRTVSVHIVPGFTSCPAEHHIHYFKNEVIEPRIVITVFSLHLIVINSLVIEVFVEMTLRSADRLEYFCGRIYKCAIDMEEHRRARGHLSSHVCRNSCRHPPVVQYDFTVRKGGCCGKLIM